MARRRKSKPSVAADLPEPGERQQLQFPEWWATTDQLELEVARRRCKHLLEGGCAAIAKEAGFSISADDITKAQSEISDKELEAASGGLGAIQNRRG